MIDPFETTVDLTPKVSTEKTWKDNAFPDPWKHEPTEEKPPLVSPENELLISKFFQTNPNLRTPKLDITIKPNFPFEEGSDKFNPDEPWIQTFSGRRFNPTNPVVDAIVIQDIAHSLSLQCRFTGHVRRFYSIAQHCVLVSYLCDKDDRRWGLLHDGDEAYIPDLSSPLKHSGKFDTYRECGKQLQIAICKRFGLPEKEPTSVKFADILLLATEARDLMSPLHPDWKQPMEPLPFKIEPWGPDEAEDKFTKRFYELWEHTNAYEHYLASKYGR
jgi:hypothetical protein